MPTLLLLWLSCALVQQPGARPENPAVAAQPRPDKPWAALNETFNARARQGHAQGDIGVIFLGDSITQRWEGPGAEVWEQRYAPRHAVNFGISGDRTQHLLWRIEHGNLDGLAAPESGAPPKLVVLLIGCNNTDTDTADQIAAGIGAVLQAVRARLPQTPVLLLGVFPRGERATHPIRAKVARINRLASALADGDRVTFLDIGEAFLAASRDTRAPRNDSEPPDTFADIVTWAQKEGRDARLDGALCRSIGLSDGSSLPVKQQSFRSDDGAFRLSVGTAAGRTTVLLVNERAGGAEQVFVTSPAGLLETACAGRQSDLDAARATDAAVAQAFEQSRQRWLDHVASLALSPEIMPDFVHLSPQGYRVWADAMEPTLRALLGEPPPAAAPTAPPAEPTGQRVDAEDK